MDAATASTTLAMLGLSAGSGMGAAKVLLEKLLGPTLDAAGAGMVPVSLQVWKERRVRRAEVLLELAGATLRDAGAEAHPVPGRILWPVLEKASVEEDHDLFATWSRLLANAARHSGGRILPSYVHILGELSPKEVLILRAVSDSEMDIHVALNALEAIGGESSEIDEQIAAYADSTTLMPLAGRLSADWTMVSLLAANLSRLGLVTVSTIDELQEPPFLNKKQRIKLTEFGTQFVWACSTAR
jgi:hypothetical protein